MVVCRTQGNINKGGAFMKNKNLLQVEVLNPQTLIIFNCPRCKNTISGEFDVHSCCPFCGYTWGKYCRICLECKCLHLPVYKYCPSCGKKTKIVINENLLCKNILSCKLDVAGYYLQQRFGWPFDIFKNHFVEGVLEVNLIEKTPSNKLPLLLGKIKTPAGLTALEGRLKSGK
jgi:hypothetical protein